MRCTVKISCPLPDAGSLYFYKLFELKSFILYKYDSYSHRPASPKVSRDWINRDVTIHVYPTGYPEILYSLITAVYELQNSSSSNSNGTWWVVARVVIKVSANSIEQTVCNENIDSITAGTLCRYVVL